MPINSSVSSSPFIKNSVNLFHALTIFILVWTTSPSSSSSADEVKTKKPYYGKYIGDFPEAGLRDHYLSGKVYAVDSHRFFIYAQNYDGTAPMAYYWVGNSSEPDRQGQPITWPSDGSDKFTTVEDTKPLPRAFAYENVLVEMPSWVKISDYTWLSMWCNLVHRSFGHVKIPPNFSAPQPRPLLYRLDVLDGVEGISSGPVTILNSKALLIKKLNLNAAGLDAGFYVGTGNINITVEGAQTPLPTNATRLFVEVGLKSYTGKDLALTLPPDVDVDLMDASWLSLYSESRGSHLLFMNIPKDLMRDSLPPDMKDPAITNVIKREGLNESEKAPPQNGTNHTQNLDKSSQKPLDKNKNQANSQMSINFDTFSYLTLLWLIFVTKIII